MAIYLHYFETENDYNQDRYDNYEEPWVSLTESIDRVDYNKTEDEKLLGMPFTIEALGDGNISWKLGDKSLQYSKNGGEWTTMDSGTSISVVAGDEVQFKGENTNYCGNTISATTEFNVKGNIMSLTDKDNFVGADSVNASAFTSLFSGCTAVTSTENLKLPATTLALECYHYMFYGCTSLTTAPELPATTLASSCYIRMFQGCASLTTAPVLPATALTDRCYYGMFYGCTNLTTAPELPATTLGIYCYCYMFKGCTSITAAPELPATALTTNCYDCMFYDCTSLTTAPELPATTLANLCYFCMFQGCASLTTAPVLPATALTDRCYDSMFLGCTSLNYIKAMFTTTPGIGYTTGWVSGVSATGTFVKNSAATWTTTGANGVPSGWTVETASS